MDGKIKKIKKNEYVIGGICSIFFTFIALIILSCLLAYTSVPESCESIVIIIVNSIAIFIGSFVITRKRKNKGIIIGGGYGLIYIIIMYLISSFISMNFSLNMNSIIMIISSAIMGMVGGIVGVNVK